MLVSSPKRMLETLSRREDQCVHHTRKLETLLKWESIECLETYEIESRVHLKRMLKALSKREGLCITTKSACLKCSRTGNACEFTTSAFLKCFKMESVLSRQSPDIC